LAPDCEAALEEAPLLLGAGFRMDSIFSREGTPSGGGCSMGGAGCGAW